jgi:hypothetical protein
MRHANSNIITKSKLMLEVLAGKFAERANIGVTLPTSANSNYTIGES